MIQGAGSNVGKSVLVAGLCRVARRRGLRVVPFKPQNMSNNAAVTVDGGEIGRAQALQALAAGVEPLTDMNPVLLKPETETGAQVIVQGQRRATLRARAYAKLKPSLMAPVLDSFRRLEAAADLVLGEGAGSPAEVNLRAGDIANMGFATAADVPVVLVGDIDRGGVIAQLVGTQAVLDRSDAGRIKGFLINKFRGDPSLFDAGYDLIAARTGWRGFGTLPWFAEARRLPAEDALDLRRPAAGQGFRIACPELSRIANFDDLDPLIAEPGVSLTMVASGQALPGDADLVILPGSKSTRGDLAHFRREGWDIDLYAHLRRGGAVLGLCGGYQMLGQRIDDPDGIEGPAGSDAGLGLLDVVTAMYPAKQLTRVRGTHVATGAALTGYEIHIGATDGPDRSRPFARIAQGAGDGPALTGEGSGRDEGAVRADGRVAGTYLHGVFAADAFRRAWLTAAGAALPPGPRYAATVEATLDALADHLEAHLDIDALFALAETSGDQRGRAL